MSEREPVVLTSESDGILVITINRPERRNAIDSETRALLHAAVEHLETTPELRVGIITGAGTAAFCAGLDLIEVGRGVATRLGGADGGFAGITRYPRSKPLIAAVNGAALGGGFEIVLACDLVIAAEEAWFALPEPQRGILPGGGGAVRLPLTVPRAIANDVLLAGHRLTAAEAERWGLVNRVVPAEELVAAAIEKGNAITKAAPLAVAGTMAIAGASRRALEAAAWDVNDANVRFIRTTDDAKEGPRAFAEKREPKWTGR